mgnify:CR=1 FL=1|jgi:hypothetical protein
MVMNMNPFMSQQQPNLGDVNEATLMALAQQGNPQFTHAALLEQAAAQQQMQQMAAERNIEVPKVNFYPSRHASPWKARRADIKQAYRLLKPTKRSFFDPRRYLSKYRYNKDTSVCCVDGCHVKELIQYDNLYARISDEETGRSLWEMYWQNPVTGEPEAFLAREGVTSGRKMRGTYCPEHLHLYHLLCKWEEEEDKEAELNPSRFRDKVKQGVSIVTVPVAAMAGLNKGPVHPLVTKYEPFFAEISADARTTDAIEISHLTDPDSGENDITLVRFDMRYFKKELLAMNQPTQAFQEVLNQQAQVIPPTAIVPEALQEGPV